MVSPATAKRERKKQRAAEENTESRNFFVLVIYQIIMRTGWIFKTESSIMPAVLDALGGAGWMRGALPLLNRFGQSVPPLLAARSLKLLPQKKWAFVGTTTSLGIIFALLTALFAFDIGISDWVKSLLFLVLYAAFFMVIGINQLSYNTLQGKLIRPTWRGRLLTLGDMFGASSAVLFALLLLPRWLNDSAPNFAAIFGFSALLFAMCSITARMLMEHPDNYTEPPQSLFSPFVAAWTILRTDRNFRRTALVAALFSSSLILFPHYQKIASEHLQLGASWLVWWVVAQNIGTAVFSIATGPMADRVGNRQSLRILTLLIGTAPQLAMFLMLPGKEALGKQWYFLVYVLIGMTPVAQKTFNNYTLEIAPPEQHPRYLSTLSLCMAAPIVLSPFVGLLIDTIGFAPVFHGITAVLLLGALICTTLIEPRARRREAATAGEESL